MKLQIFSVMDKAVGAFLQPFFSRAKGEAVRSFADACNDEKHNFNTHASDYLLVHLGEFDDTAGTFKCHEPIRIISAVECLVDEPFREDNKVKEGISPRPVNGAG